MFKFIDNSEVEKDIYLRASTIEELNELITAELMETTLKILEKHKSAFHYSNRARMILYLISNINDNDKYRLNIIIERRDNEYSFNFKINIIKVFYSFKYDYKYSDYEIDVNYPIVYEYTKYIPLSFLNPNTGHTYDRSDKDRHNFRNNKLDENYYTYDRYLELVNLYKILNMSNRKSLKMLYFEKNIEWKDIPD
jgi:hypothetical protein